MKKFFASLFDKSKLGNSQAVDPKKILFSVPTLSDDIAPLEPLIEKPTSKDFGFHEDEWCQIEFLPKSQLKPVQQMLKEYKQFEQAHRIHNAWNDVYVRKIQRMPVLSAPQPIEKLEHLLEAKSGNAPYLFTYSSISGKVKNGFTIPLGGNITLYGYVDKESIPVLGADVDTNPDDFLLTNAFLKLNASDSLILVDWRAQMLIMEAPDPSQIGMWRP
jgi:hypothetical protein